MPRRVLAAKGGIADPDQPCHSTFGPPPSSSGRQLVGPQLCCLEPGSGVHPTESTGPWIPWALLWLILQVLVPCKRPPGQLAAGTFSKRDVVEYYLLVPILRPCEVSSAMSIRKDGLHQFLLHSAQGHAREMLRVEPGVRCYLQHSISLVIRNVGAQPPCHELSKRPGKVGGATHAFGVPAAPLTDEEILLRVWQSRDRELGTPRGRCFVVRVWASM